MSSRRCLSGPVPLLLVGYGVDDVHLMTGRSYALIASLLVERTDREPRLRPYLRLARKRAETSISPLVGRSGVLPAVERSSRGER